MRTHSVYDVFHAGWTTVAFTVCFFFLNSMALNDFVFIYFLRVLTLVTYFLIKDSVN